MKYIFLDIDGVLATNSTYGVGTKNKWGAYMFDVKCVAVFNFILQETGAEIILTSDWRVHYTLQEMREIFAHNGVIRGPIGFTQVLRKFSSTNFEEIRANEIKGWLELHAWKNDIKWVAIDDLNMDEWLHPNFVLCPNHQDGIKRKGLREIIIDKLK
jgi:hypothetical protein